MTRSPELAASVTAARAVLGDYQATLAAAPLTAPPGREWMLRLARELESLIGALDAEESGPAPGVAYPREGWGITL